MSIKFTDFLKQNANQQLYIYGAGLNGQIIASYCRFNGIKIYGFIVSDGYKKSNEINKIHIYEFSELNKLNHSITIINTVVADKSIVTENIKKNFHDACINVDNSVYEEIIIDVLNKLKEIKINKYIFGNGFFANIMQSYLFESINIDIKGKIIPYYETETINLTTINKMHITRTIPHRFNIPDFDASKHNIIIILAASEYGRSIVESLSKTTKTKWEIVDLSGFTTYFLAWYAVKFLSSYGIDPINDKIISINGTKIWNPFTNRNTIYSDSIWLCFYLEIMSPIFGIKEFDWDVTPEGCAPRYPQYEYVFDIGANYGFTSCYAASKGCHVYAFEPGQKALNVLKEQQKLYPQNINIIDIALSNKEGSLTFYDNENFSVSFSMMKHAEATKCTQETIHTKPLDTIMQEYGIPQVDFMRIDIEGAERFMLQGAKETLHKFFPDIEVASYHVRDDEEVLAQILLDANPNYEITYGNNKMYARDSRRAR